MQLFEADAEFSAKLHYVSNFSGANLVRLRRIKNGQSERKKEFFKSLLE